MKVILRQDVKSLGKIGKVCDVSDGYARNYLLPRQLAVEATPGNLKDIERKNDLQETRRQQEKEAAEALAKRLSDMDVRLVVKCGDKGRLFGSVTTKEIAEFLAVEHSISLDKRKIELKEPIRALGDYKVILRLFPEVSCEMVLHVIPLTSSL